MSRRHYSADRTSVGSIGSFLQSDKTTNRLKSSDVGEKTLADDARGLCCSLSCLSKMMQDNGCTGSVCHVFLNQIQQDLRDFSSKLIQLEQGDFTQRLPGNDLLTNSFNRLAAKLESMMATRKAKERSQAEQVMEMQKKIQSSIELLDEARASKARFKYLAEHDELTKTYNRSYFYRFVLQALPRVLEKNQYSCIALLDLDNFKYFNDTYGHAAGDRILEQVSLQSGLSLRAGDVMARFGGEEFIFFFRNSSLEQGFTAAERIRRVVSNCGISMDDGSIVTITASLGVAEIRPEDVSEPSVEFLQQIIKQADEALYLAKSGGRNRTVTARKFID